LKKGGIKMPITPTYPGVYVEEIPSGVRTIVGVSTSIAVFIGRASQGPLDKPVLCLNYSDFERNFSSDTIYSDMPRYVKLFFMNGGTQCYAMRIANGASPATVSLQSEAGVDVLDLTAKQAGLSGESIRAAVTYKGQQPEASFNMEIFRWEINAVGNKVKKDREEWKNLSMNPNSNHYAPDFITQNSKLVDAALSPGAAAVTINNGFSQSGRPIPYSSTAGDEDSLHTSLSTLIGSTVSTNKFKITVDGNRPVEIDLSSINIASDIRSDSIANTVTDITTAIKGIIETEFTNEGFTGITVNVTLDDVAGLIPPAAEGDKAKFLRISSANASNNCDVYIQPASDSDCAASLMLGTAQGGLEVSAYAVLRPAPTGITFKASDPNSIIKLANEVEENFTTIQLSESIVFKPSPDSGTKIYKDSYSSSPNGNNDGVRQNLALIRDAINNHAAANPRTFSWKAELWGYRLALLPGGDDENLLLSTFATTTYNIATSSCTNNVQYYSVGTGGTTGFQTPAASLASEGTAPQISDYDNAYEIIDKEVDLFNLMILPPDANPAQPMSDLWGAASVFCQKRRAFLLMDAPGNWTNAQTASNEVDNLRIGLIKDYSALFFPRITINDNGLKKNIGASGAIAGLMARIDGSRGVWKAPAGTEAALMGILGLEYKFSDNENGILNPRAINTLRVFPNGIVNWGARTMDGDDDFQSEYKYIPVRRLALFIEESLYRGTQWVVFEPNDEPLWSQIRLNVGAFMNRLFKQGAFQGATPKEAYLVKCDSEATTQTDINLGIVNILVGFAPLKPAEFVFIKIQQLAGQIET
jgi:hypothetical protein